MAVVAAMLRQRIITAVILVALILVAILLFPPLWFQGFVALSITLGAWEWSRLAGVQATHWRVVYTALYPGLIYVLLHLAPAWHNTLLLLSALWWLVALALVYSYPRGNKFWHRRAILLPVGIVVLLPGWLALFALRNLEQREFFILLLLALVVAADTGAYFAGRSFGKHKLAALVSPNKTWEGFAGGQLGACAVMWLILVTHEIELTLLQSMLITLGTVVLAAASVVGDLFESMLKRQAGMKDSGTLLPGHGGVLDRIDSLTAALPVYTVLLLQAGILP